MKKFQNLLLIFIFFLALNPVMAGGIGYVNYPKVIDNYNFAKTTIGEIEKKGLEIQKYLEQKEAEFNKLETPMQKQKFEASVQAELKTRETAFNDFRAKKEEIIFARIHAVSEKIRLEKGLDAILDERSVFSGGVDITDDMIKMLNNLK